MQSTRADKTEGSKRHSDANEVSRKEDIDTAPEFEDNRPEAIAQRKLKEMADNSPRSRESTHRQMLANTSTIKTIQKQEIEGQEKSVQKQATGEEYVWSAPQRAVKPRLAVGSSEPTQLKNDFNAVIQREPFVDMTELSDLEKIVYDECSAKFKKYESKLYLKSKRKKRASEKILPRYRENADVVRQAYWDIFQEEISEEKLSLLGKEETIISEEEDIESFGTIGLGGGEEDEDNITIGKDGFKMAIAGHELTLSRTKIHWHTEQEWKGKTPSLDLKAVFPVPLGPLAPLALTLSLGFSASTNLSLKLEEDASVSTQDGSRMGIKGTGEAGVEAEAKAGVGLGVTAGVASVLGEIQAALTAAISGSIGLEASVQENEKIINAGATAVLNLKGDIGAAIKGAVTLSIAFFSKDFSLTFKKWTLGEADLKKDIASIGDIDSFIPSKKDMGITRKEQRILQTINPTPTKTQGKWIKMLLKDFKKAQKAAEMLRNEGIEVEDPTFWDIIESYDEKEKYKIHKGRLIKVKVGEVIPLLVPGQVQQAIEMLR